MFDIQNPALWLGLIASIIAIVGAVIAIVRFLFKKPKPSAPASTTSAPSSSAIAVVAILALAIVGGGVYALFFHGTRSANVAGTWSYSMDGFGFGPDTVMLEQNGSQVTGTAIYSDAVKSGPESLTGTVSGNSIAFTLLDESENTVKFTGTVSDDNHVSGPFSIKYLGETNPVSGTWSAVKT